MQSRRVSGMGGAGQEQIDAMVARLRHPDGHERLRARRALIDAGRAAVPALVEALGSTDFQLRWEAAKALEDIHDPSTIVPLIDALLDEEPEVRWLAAEALARIGWPSVQPLLAALIEHSGRTLFRLGAHHVLRMMEGRGDDAVIRPVLRALQGVEPAIETPIAAEEALVNLVERSRRRAA